MFSFHWQSCAGKKNHCFGASSSSRCKVNCKIIINTNTMTLIYYSVASRLTAVNNICKRHQLPFFTTPSRSAACECVLALNNDICNHCWWHTETFTQRPRYARSEAAAAALAWGTTAAFSVEALDAETEHRTIKTKSDGNQLTQPDHLIFI